MTWLRSLILVCLLAGVARAAAHPKLLLAEKDLERVEKLIKEDETARKWSQRILREAREAQGAREFRHEPDKGIEYARELQRRVTHLALAYRLTGEQPFFDAARREMLAAAALASWDEPSFLATAETTASMALGYDWLFDRLSEAERATIGRAIVEKGLRRGLAVYRANDQSWTVAAHNVNLVSNAGMIVGALAVMDEEPKIASDVLARAKNSLAHGLRGFEPDGGWEEGATYWNYGTRYLALAVASLRSATGDMHGIEKFPGVARTGEFRMHLIGPAGKNFNFGDATEAAGDSPQMFAMAWAFKRPAYATFERDRSHADPSVFDLIWYQPDVVLTKLTSPTAAAFRGRSGVAAMRGAWGDADATYVAFKGGDTRAHHGHLDLGTFVLDALGERWAVDLGSERYNLPGYSSRLRHTIYRYSTLGQNTLAIDGGNQDAAAVAPLIAFQDRPGRALAVIDMTAAYGKDAKRVRRGVALLNARDVLVQDEIELRQDRPIAWSMHTRAKVVPDGRTALLKQNGKTLRATLLYPPGVEFGVEPAAAPMPQNQNEGVARLMVRFKVTEPTHIAVLFTPGAGEAEAPRLMPVSAWEGEGKARKTRGKGTK